MPELKSGGLACKSADIPQASCSKVKVIGRSEEIRS
jgi:hypothetical protein